MQWDGSARTWKLGGSFPAFQVDPARVQASAGRMDAVLPGPYESFEGQSPEDDAPFFITVSRKGFCRLHMSRSCAVCRERCSETLPVFSLTERACHLQVVPSQNGRSGALIHKWFRGH